MKRWLLYALLFLGALIWSGKPFCGTDVAKLSPVEVLSVDVHQGDIRLQTDTGNVGIGETVTQALEDMKKTTPGTVFLETADYLLVTEKSEPLIEQLRPYLRPNCSVCLAKGELKMEKVADYLNAHEPGISLQDLRTGNKKLPTLTTEKGRLKLVP